MSTSKKLPWHSVLLIALLSIIIGVLMGRMTSQPKVDTQETQSLKEQPAAALTVEAISPKLEASELSIAASGVIAAKEIAQVGSKVSGVVIDSVLVEVGDRVQAGQVLAVLDASAATEQVNMATAELAQANAVLAKATADLTRVQPLLEIDAISQQQYDAYKTAQIQAQASASAAQAKLKSVQLSQANTHVVAPVAGVISEKNADIGMITTGGLLFSIVKNGVLEWQASVPAAQASQIDIGQVAKIDTAGEEVAAQVSRISPIANNSRELTVHATLEDSSRLRAGMYQSGRFVLASGMATTIPYRTVVSTDGMDYVWTLSEAENGLYRATKQQLLLGGRVGDNVAVDLPTNALVVKEGGGFLKEGDLVRVSGAVK